MYILIDPTYEELTPNTHGAVQDTYLKWLKNCTTVYHIIRAAMNDEFSHKFDEARPEEMLKVLNDSYGTPDFVERHTTNCAIFNTRMREGASVTDHVLYMIEQIEHLSKLDFFLHKQLEKDMIFDFPTEVLLTISQSLSNDKVCSKLPWSVRIVADF